jgi:hypothetical protein
MGDADMSIVPYHHALSCESCGGSSRNVDWARHKITRGPEGVVIRKEPSGPACLECAEALVE